MLKIAILSLFLLTTIVDARSFRKFHFFHWPQDKDHYWRTGEAKKASFTPFHDGLD